MLQLLFLTHNPEVTKPERYPQVFNLPFKIYLCLLDQVTKKWGKAGKYLGNLSPTGYLFSEIHAS